MVEEVPDGAGDLESDRMKLRQLLLRKQRSTYLVYFI